MSRYIVLRNKHTGATLLLDTWARRMQRMRSLVFAWADFMKSQGKFFEYTLTYDRKGTLGPAHDWKVQDINEFRRKVQRHYGERLAGYAWVAEVHENGGVHYHFVMCLRRGRAVMADKSGMWDKGMSRTRSVRGPYYAAAYVGKHKQKDFSKYPKGLRLFACSPRPVVSDYSTKGIYKSEGWESDWRLEGSAIGRGYAEFLALDSDEDL